MSNSSALYLALAAASIPALVGLSGARKAKGGFRSKSASTYTRAAVVGFAGLAVAAALQNEWVAVAAIAATFVLMAVGLAIQDKEAEFFLKVAAEQRVDFVSGLPNERLFEERLLAEHSRTKRTNQRYAVAVFEIDGFALLSENDQQGGMRLLAESLTESIRNTDTLGRIGENQAGVLLVDTNADGAVIGCDRACERFFFQSCGHSDQAHVTRPLTLSVGIAEFDDDTVDPMHVVDNAKLALRQLQSEMESGIRVYRREDYVPAESPLDELGDELESDFSDEVSQAA